MRGQECAWVLAVAALCCGLALAQERRTGNTCGNDMECPDNAFCRSSTYCVCKEGFIIIPVNASHRECIKEALYGEECREQIQCRSRLGVHAECAASGGGGGGSSGVCGCKDTAHFEADRCYETALVGQRCTVKENCYLGEGNSTEKQAFCVRGFCDCQLLHSPRDGGSRCVRDASLGEPCEDQQQCASDGLECRQGTCHCLDGWASYDVSNICLKSASALGEPCDYSVQCDALSGNGGAAFCLNGQCNCTWGAREAGAPPRCWHRRLPGQDCKRDEECVSEEDEPGYCHRGRCTCATCVPDARDFSAAPPAHRPTALATALLAAALLAIVRDH